jgi:hypothetical protein
MTTPLTLPAVTSQTKSSLITDLDAAPGVRDTSGRGGGARMVTAVGNFTIPAALATTAGIRMVRIPSDAIIKKVSFGFELAGTITATTLIGCIGLVYSDNAMDGTGAVNVAQTKQFSCGCFAATTGAGFDLHSVAADVLLDVTYKAQVGVSTFTDGIFAMGASSMPIWLALTQGSPGPAQTVGAWAGYGATSLSTSPSYQLNQDPGCFFDVFFQPTSTTNLSAAAQGICEVTYVTT